MNERIRKLLVEFKEVESQHRGMEVIIGMDEINKFAELIVRECMSLVSEPGPDMNDTERGILAQIKQHFGVEE